MCQVRVWMWERTIGKMLTEREQDLHKKCPVCSPDSLPSSPSVSHPAVRPKFRKKPLRCFLTYPALKQWGVCALCTVAILAWVKEPAIFAPSPANSWRIMTSERCAESQGAGSRMVGPTVRDRESGRELDLCLSVLQHCLIEGFFNAEDGRLE